MSDEKKINEPAGLDLQSSAQVLDIVRVLGLALSNLSIYGHTHKVTLNAVVDSYSRLSEYLNKNEQLNFGVSEAGLLINGNPVEIRNPLAQGFVDRLADQEVSGFTFLKGITQEEFCKLVEVLGLMPEKLKAAGGFAQAITEAGLEHVRAKVVTYKAVTEDQMIVSEQALESAVKGAGISEQASTEIVAFLKGNVGTGEAHAAMTIRDAATDAGKLAELIMSAADIRPGVPAETEGGESLEGIVVGCLRRAYDGLSQDPAVKTKKGKKTLKRTLALLEGELLNKLRELGKGAGEVEAVSSAVVEMTDELEIDEVASEFAKKQEAARESEKRILRIMAAKGGDGLDETGLKEKLLEMGVSADGWRQLLVKSGAGSGRREMEASGLSGTIGTLTNLLSQLDKGIEMLAKTDKDVPPDNFEKVVEQVNQEVGKLAVHTEEKIKEFVESAKSDETTEGAEKTDKKPSLSRQALIALLAEIVQELCQPLAVVNCSIGMLRRHAATLNPQQGKLLTLASSSTDRLQYLVNRLMEISGVPTTLTPSFDG